VVGRIREDVQVVLLDMKLNGINGLDVLKEIRRRYPYLPVILVTGYREEMGSVVKEALKINAYTCLYKPFPIEELIEVLREVHHQGLKKVFGQPVRQRS
jgi:DNA-binding NtrC family response regulator